ncbi:pyrimidine 5'-nucleotidase [Roseovarius nanhaiticus]|uniref:Putative hydrolase of the HAD superfamily n=1 Tax=Roseovarius nanhaiticus TaxID=573024 RepID=A0A1N7EU08_9RHOB|nr:pyrimidine 5'-nucleotidase [Roseovarius nanhaiticus]SEK66727.1 putative hydrolase of the HAD superfamily [Roseovarius nanhaiticus]SIR91556.1 putative hydrolase of the HAD superfamily [Roseovarius nanhaiticus]
MPKQDFSHVDAWVFDLDNTLYSPHLRLFDQIEVRMTQFVMDELGVDHAEADRLRVTYWREHGTTLAGLMNVHGLDPEQYMIDVHDIDMSVLSPDPELRARITALPGRKIIFTNGSAPYAERVAEARGLAGVFDAVYGVEHAGYIPKPGRDAFEAVFAADGLVPGAAAMFEDDPRNLAQPHEMGLATVLVAPEPHDAPHIHHHTDDLSGFLSRLI